MLITVIVTGNHFVFDLLVGAVVMAFGFAAAAPFHARTRDPAYERI